MTALTVYRADGPLLTALRGRARVPLPALAPTLAAAALAAVAVVLVLVGDVGGGRAVAAVVAAWALAVVGGLGREPHRTTWPVPGLLRAVEYLGVIALGGGGAWGYALLGALAFHHYDLVYRSRGGGPPSSPWVAAVTGGWELRLALLLVASLVDLVALALVVLTVLVTPIVVAESVSSWRRHTR